MVFLSSKQKKSKNVKKKLTSQNGFDILLMQPRKINTWKQAMIFEN